jgi:hypothetical protein
MAQWRTQITMEAQWKAQWIDDAAMEKTRTMIEGSVLQGEGIHVPLCCSCGIIGKYVRSSCNTVIEARRAWTCQRGDTFKASRISFE